jgi:hypothetical protein
MAELGRVSRPSFYRFARSGETELDPDMNLPDAIQRIALEWPCYGRRRITSELRRRDGYVTTFCNLSRHTVFDVVFGRSEAALERYLNSLPGKEGVRVV